jgi:hypothetical protein
MDRVILTGWRLQTNKPEGGLGMPGVRTFVETYQTNSVRLAGLRKGVNRTPPLSLAGMMAPVASKVHYSGEIDVAHIAADANLTLRSDGSATFAGEAHDTATLGDDNFSFTCTLLWADPDGKVPVWSHEGTIGTGFLSPDRDEKWGYDSNWQSIANDWDRVASAQVHFHLHQSRDWLSIVDDVAQVIGRLVEGGAIIVGAGLAGYVLTHVGGDSPYARCKSQFARDNDAAAFQKCMDGHWNEAIGDQ